MSPPLSNALLILGGNTLGIVNCFASRIRIDNNPERVMRASGSLLGGAGTGMGAITGAGGAGGAGEEERPVATSFNSIQSDQFSTLTDPTRHYA